MKLWWPNWIWIISLIMCIKLIGVIERGILKSQQMTMTLKLKFYQVLSFGNILKIDFKIYQFIYQNRPHIMHSHFWIIIWIIAWNFWWIKICLNLSFYDPIILILLNQMQSSIIWSWKEFAKFMNCNCYRYSNGFWNQFIGKLQFIYCRLHFICSIRLHIIYSTRMCFIF